MAFESLKWDGAAALIDEFVSVASSVLDRVVAVGFEREVKIVRLAIHREDRLIVYVSLLDLIESCVSHRGIPFPFPEFILRPYNRLFPFG